jgi:hypothetical protein
MLVQGNDKPNCSVITGLLQSQPSGWHDLVFPIKLKSITNDYSLMLYYSSLVAMIAPVALCLFDRPRRSLQKMRRFVAVYSSRQPAQCA